MTHKWQVDIDDQSTIVMGADTDDARDAGICSLRTSAWLDDYDFRRRNPDAHTEYYLSLYTRAKVTPLPPSLRLVKGERGDDL